MALIKNKTTEENRAYWKFVEETAEQVRHWPKWMGGEAEEPVYCPTCQKPLKD
jgi:hypothetical protein